MPRAWLPERGLASNHPRRRLVLRCCLAAPMVTRDGLRRPRVVAGELQHARLWFRTDTRMSEDSQAAAPGVLQRRCGASCCSPRQADIAHSQCWCSTMPALTLRRSDLLRISRAISMTYWKCSTDVIPACFRVTGSDKYTGITMLMSVSSAVGRLYLICVVRRGPPRREGDHTHRRPTACCGEPVQHVRICSMTSLLG